MYLGIFGILVIILRSTLEVYLDQYLWDLMVVFLEYYLNFYIIFGSSSLLLIGLE